MKRRLEKIEARMPREADAERRKMLREMSEDELRAILREGTRPGWRKTFKLDSELDHAFHDLPDEAVSALTRERR